MRPISERRFTDDHNPNIKSIYEMEKLAMTIAETIFQYPPGICEHCIDTILQITKSKMEAHQRR